MSKAQEVVVMIFAPMLAGVWFLVILPRLRRRNEAKRKTQEDLKSAIARLEGKTFAVRVRTPQGKKCDMETVLIGQMLGWGLKVLTSDSFDSLPADAVAVSATYQCSSGPGVVHHLDMRAAQGDMIVAAAQLREYSMKDAAQKVIEHLAQSLK